MTGPTIGTKLDPIFVAAAEAKMKNLRTSALPNVFDLHQMKRTDTMLRLRLLLASAGIVIVDVPTKCSL